MRVKNLDRNTLAARRAAVRYAMQHRFLGSRKAIEHFLMEVASDAFIATFARACREQRPISVEILLTAAMGQHNTVLMRQSLEKGSRQGQGGNSVKSLASTTTRKAGTQEARHSIRKAA